MYTIIETNAQAANFHLFVDLPKSLYPADSVRFRLPETLPTEWLAGCFVLLEDGAPVARASLYDNPHLRYQDKKTFSIGNYEAQAGKDLSLFFAHLSTVASRQGVEYLLGNMNGSTWESYRFSLHQNSPNFFLEPYHHLYYNNNFIEAGFEVVERYFSSLDKHIIHNQPEVLALEAKFKEMGVTFRGLDLSQYDAELERVYAYNALAYQTNFLYSPISLQAFMHKYALLQKIINPNFVILAEDKMGELVGCFFCVQDFWNTHEKGLVVKSASRHPDKQWRGLGLVIGNIVCRNAVIEGFTHLIHAFLREDGTSTSLSQTYSGEVYKQYALYGKAL